MKPSLLLDVGNLEMEMEDENGGGPSELIREPYCQKKAPSTCQLLLVDEIIISRHFRG